MTVDIAERQEGRNKVVRFVKRIDVLRFPAGGNWVDQEVLVSEAFNVIANAVRKTISNGH